MRCSNKFRPSFWSDFVDKNSPESLHFHILPSQVSVQNKSHTNTVWHSLFLHRVSTLKWLWLIDTGPQHGMVVELAPSVHLLNDCFLCVSQWAGAAFLHLLHYWVRRSLKTWLSSSMTSLDFQRLVWGVKQTTNNITTAVKLQKKKKTLTKEHHKVHNIQLVHCISGFLKPYGSFVWETDLKLKFFVTRSIFMNHFDF